MGQAFADEATLGSMPDHVGRSSTTISGVEHELDVVVATSEDPDAAPTERRVTAIGEAKAGETIDMGHLRTLERARAALGLRAAQAKLLLFAPAFSNGLTIEADRRHDIELVDLDRLFHGT